MDLRPVTFKMNEKSGNPGQEGFGLIAEEVVKVFPELVTYDEEGRPEGVQYSKLAILLLKAYQEKEIEVREQKAAIEEKPDIRTDSEMSENARLKAKIAELESKLDTVLEMLDNKADKVEIEPVSVKN